MRKVASQINVPGQANKDKARAPQRDTKPDPIKRVKTGHPSPKVGNIKCYDATNPTARIRLIALPQPHDWTSALCLLLP